MVIFGISIFNMSLNINVATVWKEVQQVFINVAGTWRTCADVFINVAGTWKSIHYTAGTIVITSIGSYSFTVPAGVYTVTAEVIAAGGAGGYSILSGDIRPGSGGGSGGWQSVVLSVIPGQLVTGIVGAGGVANTSSGYAASGGNSTVIYNAITTTVTGGGGGHGPIGDNAAIAGGTAGSPNGVVGGNIYTNSIYRNSAVTELGGINSKSIGNGGNGRRGDGGVASTSGGVGRVTLTW